MSKDKHKPAPSTPSDSPGDAARRPGPTMTPWSEWTFAGVGRQLVKLPLLFGVFAMLTSPFAENGGEQLGSGFLVLMASLVIGAFFQLVDERSR